MGGYSENNGKCYADDRRHLMVKIIYVQYYGAKGPSGCRDL